MTMYGGAYRAVLTTVLASGACKATIPQVFGDTEVPVEVYGATPAAGTKGFVSFVGGKADYPVFLSSGGGVGGSTGPAGPAGPTGPAGAGGGGSGGVDGGGAFGDLDGGNAYTEDPVPGADGGAA